MLNSSLPVRRSAFVALAAVALIAVLLRPVCHLWFAPVGAGAAAFGVAALSVPIEHGGESATQCCANVSDAHQIAPLQVVSSGVGASGEVAPAALLAIVTGIAILTRQLRWLRVPPRRPQSFYLRSARILR
jgi:hypothetical protein